MLGINRRYIIADQSTYTATNLPVDGQTIDAADVNTDLQGLIDEFNKNVGTTKLTDAGVTAVKLSTSTILLGKTETTNDFSTTTVGSDVDVTNLTVTVTVPTGGRLVKVTAWSESIRTSAATGTGVNWSIKEGSTVLTSMVVSTTQNFKSPCIAIYSSVASAGSHTYKMAVQQSGAGTLTQAASSTAPAFIMVELI